MINKERVLQEFLKYVQIDSPTTEEAEFGAFMKSELESLGFEVTVDDAGEKLGCNTGNHIAKLKGTTDGEPILFSCHLDTVSPGRGIKPEIRDGVIYSDGTTILAADDKAGSAALIEALRTIKENNIPHGDIEISMSIYEEGGLHGAKNLDFSQFKSKKAFVLDSGGAPGEIINRGPAQDQVTAKITGKAAHAGVSPEDGVSAIQIAAEAISNMKLLRIDPETTANIGEIKGGGATNIVVSEITVFAEARSLDQGKLDKQSNHMADCFIEAAEKFGGEAVVDIENSYPPFSIAEDSDIVLAVVKACENMGVKAHTGPTGGGSDTNIFNANGIEAVNLGVGMKHPHALTEHISIDDLTGSAQMILEIIKVFA